MFDLIGKMIENVPADVRKEDAKLIQQSGITK